MLIKCSECGKEFSDQASVCPNCGCPTSTVLKKINHEQNINNLQNKNEDTSHGRAILFFVLVVLIIATVIKVTANWNTDSFTSVKDKSESTPKYSRAPVMISKINAGFSDLGWGQSPKATKKLKLKKSDNLAQKYEPTEYVLQTDNINILDIGMNYYLGELPSFWFYRNKLLSVQAAYRNTEAVFTQLCQTFAEPSFHLTTPFPPGINIWDESKVQIKLVPLNGYCVLYVNHKSLVKSLNDERRKHNLEDW